MILIPVSLGELYDKISILEIKMENILDHQKIKLVEHELLELEKIADKHPISNKLKRDIKAINTKLWDIEDKIRIEEKNKTFNSKFKELARSVYYSNDERARIKREINETYDSDIVEVKSYENYE